MVIDVESDDDDDDVDEDDDDHLQQPVHPNLCLNINKNVPKNG